MSENRLSNLPLVEAVTQFMAQCGQRTTNNFDPRLACLYTGLQLEELAEKIEVIAGGTVSSTERLPLAHLRDLLVLFANRFKSGHHMGDILRCNHADYLDADFDLAWVSVGSAHAASADVHKAFEHGTFTNMDKLRDGCVKDENGKLVKPADWQKPDFEPYTDKMIRV